MRRLVLLLILLGVPGTQTLASMSFQDPRPTADPSLDVDAAQRAWVELQALQKATPDRVPHSPVGRYSNRQEQLLLAADGSAALIYSGSNGEPDSAWLGKQVPAGEWLLVQLWRPAMPPEGVAQWRDQLREERLAEQAERKAWLDEYLPRMKRFVEALESDSEDAIARLTEDDPESFPAERMAELEAMDADARSLLIEQIREGMAMMDATPEETVGEFGVDEATRSPGGVTLRLLPLPYGDGWLLVSESSVTSMADSWNQYGRLRFSADYWNDSVEADEQIEHGWRSITYPTPLPSNLPSAITSLLLDAPRLVTVLEWPDDLAELDWKAHEAKIRLAVDFGSKAGARSGMTIYGIAPDERWSATLSDVDQDSAIATVNIERFSPWDEVEIPTRGIRFSTRSPRVQSETCGFDNSIAVQASVIEVVDADRIEWDADGFAFLRLRIDQGRAQGLLKDDEFQLQDYSLGPGEGRVETVESQQAVVLWRMQRYHPSMTIEAPSVGVSLVTPAWRRASYDTFGTWDGKEASSADDGLQDAAELH